ncbi:hypothetical protein ACRRTK_022207 [Alexandromys fortis]
MVSSCLWGGAGNYRRRGPAAGWGLAEGAPRGGTGLCPAPSGPAPPPASPPPAAAPPCARRRAGRRRGRSPAGPAPAVNIDAARVGVALLPLSEAVSRGLASA